MNFFTFSRVGNVTDALRAARGDFKFVAGGTTLVDLMKLDVERPAAVIDINDLPLAEVTRTPDGGLRIGALARNSDVANDPAVVRDYPLLSQALLSGATAQLRNMASTAGNLLQRTRCIYFRDRAMACNKRSPGSGCAAIGGFNRNLAILGTSPHCIATNPSDQNVALTALEATVHLQTSNGERAVPIRDFYLLPGSTPERETILEPGELITGVTLPPPAAGAKSIYLKLRDRASYEFALVSAAVVVTVGDGAVQRARVAMGGIGTRPWRYLAVEAALKGHPPTRAQFIEAAEILVRDATPQSNNAFKIEMARRCLVHALTLATAPA